jgi:hypothetical protein
MFKPVINQGTLALLLMLGIAQFAAAENSKYEIDYLLMDTDIEGAGYEPTALQYKHIIPYNRIIDLEGIIALGISEEKANRKTGIATFYTQKFKLSNALGFLVKVSGALEPKVHAYIHAGLMRIEYDVSTTTGGNGPDGSQSDSGLAYGFGIAFSFLKKGAFVLEFNELPDISTGNNTIKTSVLSLGYQMPF